MIHVAADGATINYRVDGPADSPWVTCMQGITNDLTFWDDQLPALAGRFRMLRYDARGHGASQAVSTGYSVAGLVGDVVGLWNALGIEESHVVGLGFGGSLALSLAMALPTRVSSLVGVACRDSMTLDFIELWRRRATDAVNSGMAPLVDPTVSRWFSERLRAERPDQIARLSAMIAATSVPGYVGHALAFTTIDLADRMGDLLVPTLFISGGEDPGGGRGEIMAGMARRAPNARHVEIPGAGHLCNIEGADAFNRLLISHLAR